MYTSHGHQIPFTNVADERPPIARCGGISLCSVCKTEALGMISKRKRDLNMDAYRVESIVHGAKVFNLRTGQYLFNRLPEDVRMKVAGTSFDPFQLDFTRHQIAQWISNHLIFDGEMLIGLFDGETILWEAKK